MAVAVVVAVADNSQLALSDRVSATEDQIVAKVYGVATKDRAANGQVVSWPECA